MATICFVGFGCWCLVQPDNGNGLSLAAAGIALGLVTAIYGVWFYRNKIQEAEQASISPS